MCFEWDKRYFREQAELKSKQKVDELIKASEAAAKASQESNTEQPNKEREGVISRNAFISKIPT